jgi:dTDP-L-rhamnose 4-epimerase
VARAFCLALECPSADGRVFNIGSGTATSVLEAALRLSEALGKRIRPVVTGKYRGGDVRHCFSDIAAAQAELGYRPEVPLQAGLAQL